MKKIIFLKFFVILFFPCIASGEEHLLKFSNFYPEKSAFTIYSQKNFSIGIEKQIVNIEKEAKLTDKDRLLLKYPLLITIETLRKNIKKNTSIDIKIKSFRGELTLFYPSCKFYLFDNSKFELNADHLEVRFTITIPIKI